MKTMLMRFRKCPGLGLSEQSVNKKKTSFQNNIETNCRKLFQASRFVIVFFFKFYAIAKQW